MKASEAEAAQNLAVADSQAPTGGPATDGTPVSSGGIDDKVPVKMSTAPMTAPPPQAPLDSNVPVAAGATSANVEPNVSATAEAGSAEPARLDTAEGGKAPAPPSQADVSQKAEEKSEERSGGEEPGAPAIDLASPEAPAASGGLLCCCG